MKIKLLVLSLVCLFSANAAFATDDCGTINTALVREEMKQFSPEMAQAVIGMFVGQYECDHDGDSYARAQAEKWGKILDLSQPGTWKSDQALEHYLFWSAEARE